MRTAGHPTVRRSAVTALADKWHDTDVAFDAVCHATADSFKTVRGTALGLLVDGWRADPRTRVFLFDRAGNDPREGVRDASVNAIIKNWPADDATSELLRRLALSENNRAVLRQILQAVAKIGGPDGDFAAAVSDRARTDPAAEIRATLLVFVYQLWPGEEAELLARERAGADPHESVRIEALRIVVEIWKFDGRADSLLRDRALSETSADAIAAVFRLIGRAPVEPRMRPWLRELVLGDRGPAASRLEAARLLARSDREFLRGVADRGRINREFILSAIAGVVARAEDDTEWLHRKIREDPEELVRYAALKALATARNDTETCFFLEECATSDESGDVRQLAMFALYHRWRHDPHVRELLDDLGYEPRVVTLGLPGEALQWVSVTIAGGVLGNLAYDALKQSVLAIANRKRKAAEEPSAAPALVLTAAQARLAAETAVRQRCQDVAITVPHFADLRMSANLDGRGRWAIVLAEPNGRKFFVRIPPRDEGEFAVSIRIYLP